jgi:hypothetical protein
VDIVGSKKETNHTAEKRRMNLFEMYQVALEYDDFLTRYASEIDKQSWRHVQEQVKLTNPQRQLLKAFTRQMPVLCLAGAWCPDCQNQCPIFDQFAAVAPVIQMRYLDRDEHADLRTRLHINGGNRVPVLVFFSEDGCETARYGERTLSTYRQLVGRPSSGNSLLADVTQDWLNEFERVQWILRLSPRLRQLHGD